MCISADTFAATSPFATESELVTYVHKPYVHKPDPSDVFTKTSVQQKRAASFGPFLPPVLRMVTPVLLAATTLVCSISATTYVLRRSQHTKRVEADFALDWRRVLTKLEASLNYVSLAALCLWLLSRQRTRRTRRTFEM
jgi:hypothetical protein